MLDKIDAFTTDKDFTIQEIKVSSKERVVLGSSSKGSQLRWLHDNCYVKLNLFGYEDIAEVLSSVLLDNTGVSHAKYFLCSVVEDGVYLGNGCYSENFLSDGEELISFERILARYFPNTNLCSFDDVRDALYEFCGIDVRDYLDSILCLDAIIRNEDRHFHNLSLVKRGNEYQLAPVFDNGLSCLSDLNDYPMQQDFDELYQRVRCRLFSSSFDISLKRVLVGLCLDTEGFSHDAELLRACIPNDRLIFFDRALRVIEIGLERLKGKAWNSIRE